MSLAAMRDFDKAVEDNLPLHVASFGQWRRHVLSGVDSISVELEVLRDNLPFHAASFGQRRRHAFSGGGLE